MKTVAMATLSLAGHNSASFLSCVQNGNPVMESSPEQCTEGGETFVNNDPCSPCEVMDGQWACAAIDCAPVGCSEAWCTSCPEDAPYVYTDQGACCESCHATEKPCESVCCESMDASCQACSKCVSVEVFCREKGNANVSGCEDVKTASQTAATDFLSCVQNGNPVIESSPEQCTEGGETFFKEDPCNLEDCASVGCSEAWCTSCSDDEPYVYKDEGACCESCHATEKKPCENVCCMAMFANCLACSKCVSVEFFCRQKGNAYVSGCEGVNPSASSALRMVPMAALLVVPIACLVVASL